LEKPQNLSPKRVFCHPYHYEHSHETAGDERIRPALMEPSVFPNFSHPPRLVGSREFALSMIIIGLIPLPVTTLENRRDLNALKMQYPGTRRSPARVLAALISILGLLALFTATFRHCRGCSHKPVISLNFAAVATSLVFSKQHKKRR
jgi:hypothetical protein